jgi:hypothetical protein
MQPAVNAARKERDQAIDILRGLALITITVNHITGFVFRLGMKGMPFPTLSHWGFSSAAEIFFMISGYLVGAVYLRADREFGLARFGRAVGARAWKLYLYNAALFLMLLPLCLLSPMLARLSFFRYFIEGGASAWAGFALVYVQPYCLEILATYSLLLVLAPLVALALVRWPVATVLASAARYAFAHEHGWMKLPGGSPAGDWRWNFSPASWQFLFYGAMAAGRFRLLDRLREVFVRDARWFWAAVLLFGALTLLFLGQQHMKPLGVEYYVPWQSKVRVGPIRIVHALSASLVVLGLLWRSPRFQRNWIGRGIAGIGAASLQAFVASVVIAYVAGFIWIEFARSYGAYILLCLLAIAALAIFVHGLHFARLRLPARMAPQPA